MGILIYHLLAVEDSLQNGAFSRDITEMEILGFNHKEDIPLVVGSEESVSVEDVGASRTDQMAQWVKEPRTKLDPKW